MNKIKAIIVDDEAASRETLFNYLTKYCPTIDVIAQCKNIIEAEESILNLSPQLVFLDIEMPFGNGFDLLEKMQKHIGLKPFETIFITAYSQYAVKAFNYCACHYLLKPIEIEELEKAVERVSEIMESKSDSTQHLQTKVLLENIKLTSDKLKKIVLPTMDGFEVVEVGDILRCEANGNLTDFYLKNGSKKLICRTLKFYEDVLQDMGFLRIHRSHLINLSYVTGYKKGKGGFVTMSDGKEVEVSSQKKQDFLDVFKV
jgi:two-component system LytT family response regulator